MTDPRIEKLADNLINYSVSLKENENILIEIIGEEGIPLAKELFKKSYEKKANPFFNIIDTRLLRTMLEGLNEEQVKVYAKHDTEKMKDMDVYIGISSKSNSYELLGIDSEKMDLYNKYYISEVHIKERVKNTRWCILKYPNNATAQSNNMNLEQYEDFYFKVCNLDYSKMSSAMENLEKILNKTDKVRIKSKETDLTFSIKSIGAHKYIGNFNIPDGEVATSPVKNSINGYVTFNSEARQSGVVFKDIRLEFKGGKIVNALANETEKLNKILDTDEGSRYIGEFAFGLNPYIYKVTGDVLFDEKIRGSFHLAIGDSLEECDNGNRSAIHWDLVSIQTPEYGGGEIWIDDVLIRKDGVFVLEELKCLNPENLL